MYAFGRQITEIRKDLLEKAMKANKSTVSRDADMLRAKQVIEKRLKEGQQQRQLRKHYTAKCFAKDVSLMSRRIHKSKKLSAVERVNALHDLVVKEHPRKEVAKRYRVRLGVLDGLRRK